MKPSRLQEQQRRHGVMRRAISIALGLVLAIASLPVVRALSNALHIVLFCGSSALVKGLQTEVKVSDIVSIWTVLRSSRLCVIGLWPSFLLSDMHLAIPQVSNLMAMGGRQSMNSSFGSFKILNTYGAFGQRG